MFGEVFEASAFAVMTGLALVAVLALVVVLALVAVLVLGLIVVFVLISAAPVQELVLFLGKHQRIGHKPRIAPHEPILPVATYEQSPLFCHGDSALTAYLFAASRR